MKKLTEIQQKLKAPKGQFNSFGKYHYRSCEDILETLKPLLTGASLTLTDEIVNMGDRYYVMATARFSADGEEITVTAFAREEESKKGMDGSQVTGASSSYARKYALNGLFLIDDNKDSDATNNHDKQPPPNPPANERPVEVSKPQKAILRKKMAEAGLSDKEQAAFYAWVNPVDAAAAKLFIDSFDDQLTAWQEETKSKNLKG
jgi:hypothetical protein